jgi:hypothetical protein
VASNPRALLLYLQQALARLWRVAHFMLSDFLSMPLYRSRWAVQWQQWQYSGPSCHCIAGLAPHPRGPVASRAWGHSPSLLRFWL